MHERRSKGPRDRKVSGLQDVLVLILTTYDTDANVFEALQAGASGFLLKDAGPAKLLHAIRVVAAGGALLAPRITRPLIAQVSATCRPGRENQFAVLTEREREVVALVRRGLQRRARGAGADGVRGAQGTTTQRV
jgi:DNA-binding NarL/FixJ family response regulator